VNTEGGQLGSQLKSPLFSGLKGKKKKQEHIIKKKRGGQGKNLWGSEKKEKKEMFC